MENKSGAFIVGFNIKDDNVILTIGEQAKNGGIRLINVIQGKEALELYNTLMTDNSNE